MVGIELGYVALVGYENDQPLLRDRLDDVHDLKGIGAVEVACRLICDDYARVLYDSPCDRDSLPLTSGQRAGQLVPVLVDADLLKAVSYAGCDSCLIPNAYHAKSNGNVLKDRPVIQQVEVLENVTDARITDAVDLARTEPRDALAVYGYGTVIDFVESAYGVQQGRLTAAGRSQQTHYALVRQCHRGVVDDVDLIGLSLVVVLVDLFDLYHAATPPL